MTKEEIDFQIIANFMAGKGEAKRKLSLLKNFLQSKQLSFRTTVIETPTAISKIPQDGRTKIKKGVICIGGDGTVSETIGYLLNNQIRSPLAIIPTGTANIIVNTLGLNLKEDKFDFLLADKTRKVDVGLVEYQDTKNYFLLGLGLGFEENFLRLTKERLKAKLGIFSYIFAAISELLSLRKIPLVIENSQIQVKTNVCLLTVLNLQPILLKLFPLYKNRMIKGDDGLLSLYYVEYWNYFQALLGTLIFHLFGQKNFGLVKEIFSSEFFLSSPSLVRTQVDGELRGNLPIRVTLLPLALELMLI